MTSFSTILIAQILAGKLTQSYPRQMSIVVSSHGTLMLPKACKAFKFAMPPKHTNDGKGAHLRSQAPPEVDRQQDLFPTLQHFSVNSFVDQCTCYAADWLKANPFHCGEQQTTWGIFFTHGRKKEKGTGHWRWYHGWFCLCACDRIEWTSWLVLWVRCTASPRRRKNAVTRNCCLRSISQILFRLAEHEHFCIWAKEIPDSCWITQRHIKPHSGAGSQEADLRLWRPGCNFLSQVWQWGQNPESLVRWAPQLVGKGA